MANTSSSPAAFITEDSVYMDLCRLMPCNVFLRSLLLYMPNIKGKHRHQQRKKCAVLQETSATYFHIAGNWVSCKISERYCRERLSWGDAFFFTCTEVKISEAIPSLLLRLVYLTPQRQVALRSFLPAFLPGASLKKGRCKLQVKQLHLQPTLGESVYRSWTPIRGDIHEQWTERKFKL